MFILALLFPIILFSQNEVCLEIDTNPYPNNSALSCFSKYITMCQGLLKSDTN